MQLKQKKIIAREFLLLLLTILLTTGFYFSIYGYNHYYGLRWDKTVLEMNRLDSTSLTYSAKYSFKLNKQMEFFEDYKSMISKDQFKNSSEFWNILVKWNTDNKVVSKYRESPELIRELLAQHDIHSAEQFIGFIKMHSLNAKDYSDMKAAKGLMIQHGGLAKERGALWDKLLSREEHNALTLMALGIIMITLFPLRYLFNATAWSIRTLRST